VSAPKTAAPPFIPYGHHSVTEEDIAAVADVMRHSPLTQGPRIEEFEQRLSAYVGSRYAVAVSSGTAALHLASLAAGLGPGERLVTSPITFVASANCALYAGAIPAFADIDPRSLNLSPVALAAACERLGQVKVIVPVHYAGLPCEMPAIRSVAERSRAVVIEDAAHALGATYPQGGRVGNCAWSDMTIFSFHPVKLIAAGEGGMITTNDESIYRRLLRLRSHGINKLDDPLKDQELAYTNALPNPWYYEMQELGFNYRFTDIQAALAISQMKRIDSFLTRRRELALRYDKAFAGHRSIRPAQRSGRESSAHHLYVVRISFERLGTRRMEVMNALRERGIGTQVHYIPVHLHPYYRGLGFQPGDFPEAEAYYQEALSLPLYYDLSDTEQDRVVSELESLLR
jgi:perosamine synthetase